MPRPVVNPIALVKFWGTFAAKTLDKVSWEQAEIVRGVVVMLTEGRLPMGAEALFEASLESLEGVKDAIKNKAGAAKALRLLVKLIGAVEAAKDRL